MTRKKAPSPPAPGDRDYEEPARARELTSSERLNAMRRAKAHLELARAELVGLDELELAYHECVGALDAVKIELEELEDE